MNSLDAHFGQRTLVVLLHAYRLTPASLDSVVAVVKGVFPSAYVHVPPMSLRSFSRVDLLSLTRERLEEIDELWASGEFGRLIFIGHSLGALLVRKVYVAACGAHEHAPLERELGDCRASRPWARHVDRILLFAGISRGWSISHHMNPGRALGLRLGAWLGAAVDLFLPGRMTLFQFRRGAPFVTQLRIQWLHMCRRAEEHRVDGPRSGGNEPPVGAAPVIQFLGTIDDVVSPDDNIDLAAGRHFHYVDVPRSGHRSVVELNPTREELWKSALSLSHEQLAVPAAWPPGTHTSKPWHPDRDLESDAKVGHVVFVMHGIRDQGYWTSRIARAVVEHAPPKSLASETSSYGYFGMGPFLLPHERRARVEWFMDRYAEALARYPNAKKFSYVGHSHGTYMLAKALELYPCCRFDRAVFAGSVATSTYPWRSLMAAEPRRIGEVLNITGAFDWVVAYFPRFLEQQKLQDVGGAGFEGFREAHELGPVFQVRLRGGHSIGIDEGVWPAIAEFLLHGKTPTEAGLPSEAPPFLYSPVISQAPGTAWLIALGIVGLLFLLIYGLAWLWPIGAACALFTVVFVAILTRA